jgi:hypothetical protein
MRVIKGTNKMEERWKALPETLCGLHQLAAFVTHDPDVVASPWGAACANLIRRSKNMLSLECRTGLAPEKVLEELKRSFGKGGLGLEVKEENPQCITFEGGGGYVTATLCREKGKTRVDLVTREWDYHVKQFASKLK